VADFATEFRPLKAESGWNTEALVIAFHKGLTNFIKDELAFWEQGEDPESLITLEIRFDNRLEKA
jgi:hypothetical protein